MMKTLVTGGDGLLGQAIQSVCQDYFVFVTRKDADLTNQDNVRHLYEQHKPDYVIHAAARVGGVKANLNIPGELFYENILMNSHMIHFAAQFGIKKFVCLSSLCVFPAYQVPYQLSENQMHDDCPHSGHFAYAYAKRMADVQISAYVKQYGVSNFCSVFPGSMFGEFDNFNLESGHVVPSLIHKIHSAKKENKPLYVWGDGSATREFIYSKDVARIILQILALEDIPQKIIVSSPEQVSIKTLVEKLCKVSGFENEVVWQTDKPNGQNVRKSNTGLLKSLIKPNYTDIEQSLFYSYRWFEDNWPNVRI